MRPILPEVLSTIGGVPLAQYGPPVSSDLPNSLASLIDRYDAFLLEATGVSIGKGHRGCLQQNRDCREIRQHSFVAEQLGPVNCLSTSETERLLKAAGRLNIKDEVLSQAGARSSSAAKAEVPRSDTAETTPRRTEASGYR
jgi:L-fuculose-phosphate aldolase